MTASLHFELLANPKDFELLCCDLWRREWGEAMLWGTSGDTQHGVDIYDSAHHRAIQCKHKSRGHRLGKAEIHKEIEKVEKRFELQVKELIFATTTPKRVKDQLIIAEINEEQARKGSFRVQLYSWDDIEALVALYPEIRRRYFGGDGERPARLATPMPQVPEPFVPRPEMLEHARAIWRKKEARLGLYGMSGCGKTALAALIARDRATTQRFPDGVLWLTVGHSDPLALLGILARDLSATPPPLPDVVSGKSSVGRLAARRDFLLVLDDVWTVDQAIALDVVSGGSGLLVTSRNSALLKRLGVEAVKIEVLSDEQAVSLLEQGGVPSREIAEAIAAECGNLPLAMAMAGALARGPNRTWEDALRLLREAKLEQLEPLFRDYGHRTLLAAIEVGIRDLPEKDRRRYLDLAAFGKEWVPIATLEQFWDDKDLVTTLVERSLAFLDDRQRLRLHDLQADYLHLRIGDATPVHQRLIEVFRQRVRDRDFTKATPANDDGYFFQHLPRHLAAAGLHEELARLLFDFRWLSAKVAATDTNMLVADCTLLPSSAAVRSVRKALRLVAPALATDREQLASQLLSRLSGGDAEVDRLLAGARAWGEGRTWLRPLRPGLNPAGGCLEQKLACGSAVRKLVHRVNGHLDAFCEDGIVRRWDLDAGQVVHSERYEVREDEPSLLPNGLDFEHDSWAWLDAHRIVAGSRADNGKLMVWNVETRECEADLTTEDTGTTFPIYGVAALDEHRIVASSGDTVGLWNITERRFIRRFEGHDSRGIAVLECIDENHFASGDSAGVICLWDVGPAALAVEEARHSTSIRMVAATPIGAVSSSYDDRVYFWDFAGTALPRLLQENAGWMDQWAVLDADRIAGTSISGKLRVWQLEPPELVYEFDYGGRVMAIARFDDQSLVVGAGNEVHVWHKEAPRLLERWGGHDDTIMAVSPIGTRFLATASLDLSIRIWEKEAGREVARLDGAGWARVSVVDPYVVYVAKEGDRLRAWDWGTGEIFDLSSEPVWPFELRIRGPCVACVSRAGALLAINVQTRTTVGGVPPEVHRFTTDDPIEWLDENRIASGSEDHGVRVWNLRTGRCEATAFLGGKITGLAVWQKILVVGDESGNLQCFSFESPD